VGRIIKRLLHDNEKEFMIMDFLWSLKNKAHRDLSYLLASPSLLMNTGSVPPISSQEWMTWFENAKDAIAEDDQHPDTLNQFVDTPRQYKLGLYAEDLFFYYLQNFSDYEVLVHDMQVFIGKRSIGAFDFIVRAPDGGIEHWEMAIKYFVQHTPDPDWSHFIGPGGRDSLQRKMNKMLKRQILLGDRPESQEGLREKGIPIPERKKIVSMGQLFGKFGVPFVPPHGGDPQQPTGMWIFIEKFLSYLKGSPERRWVYRKHPDWITPALCKTKEESMNADQTEEFLQKQEKHIMLCEMIPVPQGWQECQRWFIMPTDWKKVEENKS
jgi:hypothetical protein